MNMKSGYLAAALLSAMLCMPISNAQMPTPDANSSILADSPDEAASKIVWPRTFQKDVGSVTIYQPQVDDWKDSAKICFRMAIALTPKDSKDQHFGVLAVKADTLVDHDARTVLITNMDIAIRFPGVTEDKTKELKKLTREIIPNKSYLDVSLDELLACMHATAKINTVDLNLDPPPLYYSDSPAILVIFMGQPSFKDIAGTQLVFAVNTNWIVLKDNLKERYYLLNGNSWLTTPDLLNGPWSAVDKLPDEFSKLPDNAGWDEAKKNIPGKPATTIPKVICCTSPAELIVTEGTAKWNQVKGTTLSHVSNPAMTLFQNSSDSKYYYLVSGRWFRATALTGPWTSASADLPAEFAKIPSDNALGDVLVSVPGTQEAKDAVMLASVPHKAEVNVVTTTVNVSYDGAPKFSEIQGTKMTGAVNTPYQVICANGKYYCCYDGVWFVSHSATGPWAVCKSVDKEIYTIPPSSPFYNTTYVQIYDSTPSTVVVGYTGGYSGQYVATTGVLMFGAGMLTGAILASNNGWFHCSSGFYSYGCCAHYNYGYGGYYRPFHPYYGPCGGAGWGAAYNPTTGCWSRGGYAYGPNGARWGAQAYNPFTNTYAAHSGGCNGYRSWGNSVVSHDGNWAASGHVSGPNGTRGWAETSSGKWAEGEHSGNSTVARASNGDVYAGHDGNVYRKDDNGQWQKYDGNGNWSDTGKKGELNNDRTARTQENAGNKWHEEGDWKNNWENGRHTTEGTNMQDRHPERETYDGLDRDSRSRDTGSYSRSRYESGSRSGGFRGGGFHGRR